MGEIYNTSAWDQTRALAFERDGHRCTVSRLLGGQCADGPLHAHHIIAVADGGDPFDVDNVGTSCASHHPVWESLRRILVARIMAPPPRCPHSHRSREARRECERRLARRQHAVAA